MAVLSDYTSGTITLANGSMTVTGTGTLFDVAQFREGDTLQIQNLTAVIASVDSDTQLTLTEPWTGTGIVNGEYRARFLPDGARVAARATTLIELLGNGVLSSIAELPVEEGKLLVGNAAGGYDPIGKGELGVQDPNGSLGKLAELALAARQILQTDESGKLKTVILEGDKALVTDENGDVVPTDLGTLGRSLIALAGGSSAQYIQGDGTIQAKSGLPVSTATQTALAGKANLSGATFTGDVYSNRSLYTGGTGNGKVIIRNSGGTQVVEIGVGVGTGFGDAVGYYTNVPTGEHYFYTNGSERLRIRNNGTVSVNGTLSKAGGTFRIDHPLDPLNKNLRHGFVEAPEYVNLYRGEVRLVNGKASVDIDDYFNMTAGTFWALNTDITVSSLQNQEGFASVKPAAKMASGVLEIVCEDEDCNDLIAWSVTGRRKDVFVLYIDENCERGTGRFIPEFDKPELGND